MERLRIAIDKARAKRDTLGTRQPPRDKGRGRGGFVPDEAWARLQPLDLQLDRLDLNRLVAIEGGEAAAPYAVLRTKVLQQAQQNGWRRIAVVSPHAKCGKTTIVTNLAFSLSRHRELKIAAIDLDLRRPTLARQLAQHVTQGMPDVLEKHLTFAEIAQRCGDNLIFGFTDRPSSHSSELLHSQQTTEILGAIEAEFTPDIMLFDLPPIMVGDDSLGFLKNVDAALIVAEAEKTPISQIDSVERQVAELTNVIGIVLNKCRYPDDNHGYGYGYGYGDA